jgi:hypothetical protein
MLMRSENQPPVLDEPPTIWTRQPGWIEDAVEDFSEALIFVSHDRYFIPEFDDRIWPWRTEAHRLPGRPICLSGVPGPAECSAADGEVRGKEAGKAQKRKAPQPEKHLARLEREIAAAEDALGALDG